MRLIINKTFNVSIYIYIFAKIRRPHKPTGTKSSVDLLLYCPKIKLR